MSKADSSDLRKLLTALTAVKEELPKAYERGLKKAGDKAIGDFQAKALAGGFLPAKAPPREGPPLVDTKNYIMSFRAEAHGGALDIDLVGDNVTMSNEELSGVLEYSSHGRRHLRPMADQLQEEGPSIVGQEVLDVLRRL